MAVTFSVVIPTYYRNERLKETVESLGALEADDLEIVVVDDSGEEHAAPVIDTGHVTYIPNEENKGVLSARRKGVAKASGEYIHFLDDDDRLRPGALLEKHQKIKERTDVGVVYSGYELDGGRIVHPREEIRGNVLEYALKFDLAPCIPSSMLIERRLVEAVDLEGIDEKGLHNEHAMQIELAQKTQYDYVDKALLDRGELDDSLGRSYESAVKYRQTIRAYDELYQNFPISVKQTALSYTHLMFGQVYIHNSLYSLRAIHAFGKALYHQPNIHPIYIGSFFSSLLGQPGYRLGRRLYQKLIAPDEHRGKTL